MLSLEQSKKSVALIIPNPLFQKHHVKFRTYPLEDFLHMIGDFKNTMLSLEQIALTNVGSSLIYFKNTMLSLELSPSRLLQERIHISKTPC